MVTRFRGYHCDLKLENRKIREMQPQRALIFLFLIASIRAIFHGTSLRRMYSSDRISSVGGTVSRNLNFLGDRRRQPDFDRRFSDKRLSNTGTLPHKDENLLNFNEIYSFAPRTEMSTVSNVLASFFPFTDVIIFGDSYSGPYLNNENERLCDGKFWWEWWQDLVGSNVENNLNVLNYARAYSTILGKHEMDGSTTLGKQIDQFKLDYRIMKSEFAETRPSFFRKSKISPFFKGNRLYIIWIGGNDFFMNPNVKPSSLLDEIKSAVDEILLIDPQANFFIPSITPGELLPTTWRFSERVRRSVGRRMDNYLREYNIFMKEISAEHPENMFFHFNTIVFFRKLVENPHLFSLNDNSPELINGVINGLNEKEIIRFQESGNNVFYDSTHVSSATHRVFAVEFMKAVIRQFMDSQ